MENKILVVMVVGSLIGLLDGCRFKREIDIQLPTEYESNQAELGQTQGATFENMSDLPKESTQISAEILDVEYKDIDLDYFAQVFMGISTIKEAEKYKPKHSFGDYYYEVDGKTIAYTGKTSGIISYNDATDGAGDCYDAIINSLGYLGSGMGNSFRKLCPNEELDTCTKEQAIEACSKYAEACGYGADSDISVYAFTLDSIEKVNKIFENTISAPGEGLKIVTRGQIEALRDEGKDDEADKMEEQLHNATNRGLPWKKEHEAMVLYYRSKLNGMLLDSHDAGLEIVYVPYTDKIVLITGNVPCQKITASETDELISKEASLSQVAQTLGIQTQNDIQIDAISLVYAMQSAGIDKWSAIPAWKVDYNLKNTDENTQTSDSGSIWIDAVSGFVADYWKQ